jgi:phage shock protein A
MSIFGWRKRMFAKTDLVDDLSHDLDRARARRDAVATDVTTLTAEIAELEARLVAEKDRRDRARIAAEIEEITSSRPTEG